MLKPGATIGILGGGQLARMMAISGASLGLRFLLLDNVADACAGQFAPMLVGKSEPSCTERFSSCQCTPSGRTTPSFSSPPMRQPPIS